MHENRETSGAPRPERDRGRSAKAQSQKADAHALEESDRAIVSVNQTNKEERSSMAPSVSPLLSDGLNDEDKSVLDITDEYQLEP